MGELGTGVPRATAATAACLGGFGSAVQQARGRRGEGWRRRLKTYRKSEEVQRYGRVALCDTGFEVSAGREQVGGRDGAAACGRAGAGASTGAGRGPEGFRVPGRGGEEEDGVARALAGGDRLVSRLRRRRTSVGGSMTSCRGDILVGGRISERRKAIASEAGGRG